MKAFGKKLRACRGQVAYGVWVVKNLPVFVGCVIIKYNRVLKTHRMWYGRNGGIRASEVSHVKKQIPISKKLFISFSCFALIPVIIIGIIGLYVSVRVMAHNMESNMSNSANQISLAADGKLEEMKYIAESFSSNSQIKELLRQPMTDANILLLREEMEKVNSVNASRGYFVTLCGYNGQIYVNWNTDGMVYRDPLLDRIRAMPWFSGLEESRSLPVWIPCGDNVADYDYQEKVVTLAKNIMNDTLEGEEVLGFVIISIPSSRISKLLSGSSDRLYVVDGDGVISMSQDAGEIGTVLEDIAPGRTGMQETVLDGSTYLGHVKENQLGGLYSVILVPADSMKRQVFLSFCIIGLSIGLSFIIIFLVANYVSRGLARPILKLEHSMQRVQRGALEKAAIETPIMEIESLADNFNIMVEQIQLLIDEKVAEEQRRKEIEVESATAELKFLRAQINPHFLFNTLNSIKWLAAMHGAAPVEEMIVALGRLLECSMQKGNDFIPLKEEMENVKAYLKIQKMRYGNKIKTAYEIDEELEDMEVPKLILQPLVENAIIHGIDKNPDGGTITVRARGQAQSPEEEYIQTTHRCSTAGRPAVCEGINMIMEVEDDGPGIAEDGEASGGEDRSEKSHRLSGIGIRNINRRIQLVYGEAYGLYYRKGKEGRGTVAVLVIKKEEHHVESTSGG